VIYELRLTSLRDIRIRDAVVAVLARWVPTTMDPGRAQMLGRSGLVLRLSLDDVAAPALLRDLYATGVAPAAVQLRPLAAESPRDRAATDPVFAVFERRGGGFVPTWNWQAFVFGPLWYLRRGLYAKGLVLLGLGMCPFFTLAVTLLLSGTVLVYCGVVGNWDDYLWKVRGTQWWAG
jgi:hypothetical protein